MANITQYLSNPQFLTNIQNVDAGGCPAPFISESLYPFREGCTFTTSFEIVPTH